MASSGAQTAPKLVLAYWWVGYFLTMGPWWSWGWCPPAGRQGRVQGIPELVGGVGTGGVWLQDLVVLELILLHRYTGLDPEPPGGQGCVLEQLRA